MICKNLSQIKMRIYTYTKKDYLKISFKNNLVHNSLIYENQHMQTHIITDVSNVRRHAR